MYLGIHSFRARSVRTLHSASVKAPSSFRAWMDSWRRTPRGLSASIAIVISSFEYSPSAVPLRMLSTIRRETFSRPNRFSCGCKSLARSRALFCASRLKTALAVYGTTATGASNSSCSSSRAFALAMLCSALASAFATASAYSGVSLLPRAAISSIFFASASTSARAAIRSSRAAALRVALTFWKSCAFLNASSSDLNLSSN